MKLYDVFTKAEVEAIRKFLEGVKQNAEDNMEHFAELVTDKSKPFDEKFGGRMTHARVVGSYADNRSWAVRMLEEIDSDVDYAKEHGEEEIFVDYH